MCLLYEDGTHFFVDFKSNQLRGYIEALRDKQPIMVALEKVASMPGQGVKSVFSFGQRFGELEGMLQTLQLPYILVRPQQWQKSCGVPPKSGKQGIHQTMLKSYPTADLTGPRGGLLDGRSDALGLAHHIRGLY